MPRYFDERSNDFDIALDIYMCVVYDLFVADRIFSSDSIQLAPMLEWQMVLVLCNMIFMVYRIHCMLIRDPI